MSWQVLVDSDGILDGFVPEGTCLVYNRNAQRPQYLPTVFLVGKVVERRPGTTSHQPDVLVEITHMLTWLPGSSPSLPGQVLEAEIAPDRFVVDRGWRALPDNDTTRELVRLWFASQAECDHLRMRHEAVKQFIADGLVALLAHTALPSGLAGVVERIINTFKNRV